MLQAWQLFYNKSSKGETMKFIILAVLGTIFLGGCTGSKSDSSVDTSADTAAE
jgi:hypothetical protein